MAAGIFRAAPVLTGHDDEAVKFVVKVYVRRKSVFEKHADFFVAGFFRGEAVAGEDALGVSVHDESEVLTRIEKNGVGRFRADAVDFEEFFSQLRGRRAKHFCEGTAKFGAQEADKGFQFFCFKSALTAVYLKPMDVFPAVVSHEPRNAD